MNASEQLIKAAKNGNVKEVRKLLSKGALFTKDEFGNTALHEAAWTGNNDIVKILLKAHCFVDSVNGAGFTPLHLAAQNGHAKVAKTLLKWKANASLKNQHEEAPIHLLAKYDHSHLIPVFAAAKTDMNIKAKDGNTALHVAAKLGYTTTVKLLIQNGADPNYSNQRSKLPIDYAEIGDYHDTVKILIPLTQRPIYGKRRATMTSSTNLRSRTPELPASSKCKKSLFGHSPSHSKIHRLQSNSPPTSFQDIDFRRQRSCSSSSSSSFSARRYSREFEDIPVRFLHNGSSSPLVLRNRGSPVINNRTSSPSLDDLLEDVEKEAHGPNYKYIPPTNSDDSEDNSSVTYKPLERILLNPVKGTPPKSPLDKTKTHHGLKHNESMPNMVCASNPPSSSPLKPQPIYDYLAPRGSNSSWDHLPVVPKSPLTYTNKTEDDSYVCLSLATDKRTSPDGEDTIYSHPVLSEQILHHKYEYLPPLKTDEEEEGEGLKDGNFDSYIFMAPRKNSTCLPQNVAPKLSSPNLAKGGAAPHCTSETTSNLMKQKSHGSEGTTAERPQSTQLERYLEEELEMLKHNFQTRLSQIEMRYKRQLASMSSVSGDSHTESFTEEPNSTVSWATDVAGRDNCCEVGDIDSFEKPKLSEFVSTNESNLTEEAKQLLQERVNEYKSRMIELFMEKTETGRIQPTTKQADVYV